MKKFFISSKNNRGRNGNVRYDPNKMNWLERYLKRDCLMTSAMEGIIDGKKREELFPSGRQHQI